MNPALRITTRTRCRICSSARVRPFLKFTDYPFSDNLLEHPTDPREVLATFEAHWCEDCGVAQNLTDFDWSTYYGGYSYTVSASPFARQFMERVAEETVSRFAIPSGASVVEIGSSDGYQLDAFRRRGMKVFGFEPGRDLAEASRCRGIEASTSLFEASSVEEIPPDQRPVDVFLSFYTFDHLPDPVAALKTMRRVLNPSTGLVIIETHDLEQIIERREACLFCHEHTIYPSARSLGRLLAEAGFRLLTTDLVPSTHRRGNSLLAAAALTESPLAASASWPSEPDPLHTWAPYAEFATDIAAAHHDLAQYVEGRLRDGARLAGYGASARSISTLALAGLTHGELSMVADANAAIEGRYLPASHVPIVPPSAIRPGEIDEVLVFAYGYLSEISSSLAAFVAAGGRLTSLLTLLRKRTS